MSEKVYPLGTQSRYPVSDRKKQQRDVPNPMPGAPAGKELATNVKLGTVSKPDSK